uniref:Aquaporin n=1 Tax=Neobodo designis TaxID=312471 RepID=A0A6U4R089_NEODS|mmetsp:Transcript_23355/g.72326  ORF Transcript_23355/g.72326 Transcript_23355/m.72326 type:complete len:253 (+) Transcript_23355:41-799(+)
MGRKIAALKATSRFGQSCIGEFIGTFMLVMIIVTAIGGGAGPHAPIAIGFGLTSLVFAYGYISKAQYTPAVTLALYINSVQDLKLTIAHMLVQVIAGVAAALIGGSLIPSKEAFPQLAPRHDGVVASYDDSHAVARAFFAEVIFTFNLAHTILNVAASRQAGNQFFGIAIGMAVLAGAYCTGSISGGSLNPAVTTGLHVGAAVYGVPGSGTKPIAYIWLYWAAELLGGTIAGLLFHFVDEEEENPDTYEALS